MSISKYDTLNVPRYQRLEYWNQAVGSCVSKLDCHTLRVKQNQDTGFNASLELWDTGVFSLSKLVSSPSLIERTKESAHSVNEEALLLYLPLKGDTNFYQGNHKSTSEPGDLSVCVNWMPYSIEMEDNNEMLVSRIPITSIRQYIAPDSLENGLKFNRDDPFCRLVTTNIQALWDTRYHSFDDHEIRAISHSTLELLCALISQQLRSCRSLNKQYSQLHKVKAYIQNNLSNSQLNNTCIAKECGISTNTLRKLFQTENNTCSRYIKTKRLNTIAKCLRNPQFRHTKIIDLAFNWGFNSAEHFTRSFKKSYGISPRQFREKSEKASSA